MTIGGGLAVYFVIWWTVLFVTLPFGVRSQAESGTVEKGTDPGCTCPAGLGQEGGRDLDHSWHCLLHRLVYLDAARCLNSVQ
jgi:hypothetical protein